MAGPSSGWREFFCAVVMERRTKKWPDHIQGGEKFSLFIIRYRLSLEIYLFLDTVTIKQLPPQNYIFRGGFLCQPTLKIMCIFRGSFPGAIALKIPSKEIVHNLSKILVRLR